MPVTAVAAIEALAQTKTLVVIAHRLSTVKKCDRLIFIKDGRVAGSGGFEDLMTSCSDFAAMVRSGGLEYKEPAT